MKYNGWDNFAQNKSLDFIVDKILTGRSIENFDPDFHLFKLIGGITDKLSILDFGCGLGRNTIGMALNSKNWTITGYDNVDMINRIQDYVVEKYHLVLSHFPLIRFVYDWNSLKNDKFDVIFCSLVLQHIYEDDLVEYLKDFKIMSKKLIVHGRRQNDDSNKNTWEILEMNGFIPSYCNNSEGYSVYGNAESHFTCVYDW